MPEGKSTGANRSNGAEAMARMRRAAEDAPCRRAAPVSERVA